MLPTCDVFSENTGVIVDNAALHPDILINADDRAPVVIEGEYDPGISVEDDARARLGLRVTESNRIIESAIALRYPETLRIAADLDVATKSARLLFAVEYEDGKRFPESGWLEGSCEDVADMARLASIPQRAVDEASDQLERGIEIAASRMNEMARLRPFITPEISKLLGLADVLQTRRMACAIIANAMVFHNRVAGMHKGIQSLQSLCGPDVINPQSEILDSWQKILKINYWPIFAIARDIVFQLPVREAVEILRILHDTANQITATGAHVAHDLTGRIFQRLIADRKYLATFYTLPSSASLLARLAVAKLEGIDWSDADALGKLRVGDFACGTGALLAAVYEQIATRHENAGGKAEDLHSVMMEEVLYGCDVMPSAVHITGATLSGVFPSVRFDGSRLYTMPYGRQRDGTVSIGSLELLQSSSIMTLFNTSDPALRTGSAGEETAAQVTVEIPDEGFDLVIMNPPFTSNTKHYDSRIGVRNAAFAAFNASDTEQKSMSKRLRKKAIETCYHGHAGLGSAFAALGHIKLKPGRVIALVLPFTAINGPSWTKFRALIDAKYEDVSIVSIAGVKDGMSFSSDTGMAECLVIARKMKTKTDQTNRASFVSLSSRPADLSQSFAVSRSIAKTDEGRQLDGPFGGEISYCGDVVAGETIDAPIGQVEIGWGAARLRDASVAQTAHALAKGKLWLPAEPKPIPIPIATLGEIGTRGLDSQLFISSAHKGPFTKSGASKAASYPALWNHHAPSETRLVCNPDSQLRVKRGMEAKAAELWKHTSRSHLNSEFTFGSQALAVAFTDKESAGGRVWPNVIFEDDRYDYAFTLWSNSTLGLLSYWWHSNRQQSSKATLKITVAPSMPTLDLRVLTDDQHSTPEKIFKDFRDEELEPAHLADIDLIRRDLDEAVICDLLGFDDATLRAVRRLAEKWCAEPSVHGGKKRPTTLDNGA